MARVVRLWSRLCLVAIVVASIWQYGAPQAWSSDPAADFYIAVQGSDDNPGTLERPFATFVRAAAALRTQAGSEDQRTRRTYTVMVRGGKYFLRQAWRLSQQDGGTAEHPVVYMAYPGETPVLSGGCKITGWAPYKDAILQAPLPKTLVGQTCVRQLFLDGKRMTRARWPNPDPTDPTSGGWAFVDKPVEPDSHKGFFYQLPSPRDPKRLSQPGNSAAERGPTAGAQEVPAKKHWANPRQGEVNVYPFLGWCNNIVPIDSVDETARIITLQHEIWRSFSDFPRYAHMPFQKGNRFIVENILEELDQPGEWCVDMDKRLVYFWPPKKLTPDSEVVMPVLDCLVDISGASHIAIDGLTFTETTTGDNYHRLGLEGYGAMFPTPGWKYCGEAMHLENAAHCTIRNCVFQNVGGNAVYLEKDTVRNEICGNRFSQVGANGVCLLGVREQLPLFNRIEDNAFDHCGVLLKYVAAVFAGLSDGNVVGHNSIRDMPHHAINLATNGYGRNLVEFNEIRDTCLELFDNGAINMWMDDRDESTGLILRNAERAGHVIRYNFIADTRGYAQGGKGRMNPDPRHSPTWGIYLDDYSSNCLVFGNIVVRSGTGICVHAGKNNIVENNIVAQCSVGQRFQDYCYGRPESKNMQGFNTGNRYRNNIVYTIPASPYLFCLFHFDERTVAECDFNLFYNQAGEYRIYNLEFANTPQEMLSLQDWQRMGYDRHSVTADPLFVDPEHDDFRLKPGSPAIALGFQPIPVDRIGVRARQIRDDDSR